MADLKTFWTNPGMPTSAEVGAGDGVVSRGTDPQVDTGGVNGLTQVHWASPPVSPVSGEETENSVSGLPLQPTRFEPPADPPEPPSLKDRSPGTIDER
jgi:hypothetical protein